MNLGLPVLEDVTKGLVDCDGCSKCCTEGGPAYVLSSEVERLSRFGVPMFEHKGYYFIQRVEGVCSMLDTETGRCTIYPDRPTSCKLFPLDIFKEDEGGPFDWMLFTYCPAEQRRPQTANPGQPTTMEIARATVTRLEEELPEATLREIADATAAVGEIDLFEPHRTDALPIKSVIKLTQSSGR